MQFPVATSRKPFDWLKFTKSLVKSIGWLFFLTIIGLLQLLMMYFYKEFNSEFLDLNDFMFNGFFLFLCVSTLAGICYEFYLENDIILSKYLNFILIFFTIAVMAGSMFMYSNIYFKNLEQLQVTSGKIPNNTMLKYVKYHVLIISCTILVSLALKTLIYYNKKTESNE